MAANKSHEASSSSSSSSHRGWRFDVFLSFRGEDTRRNFTDHLYIALQDAGINVFRDDNELPVGENISTELLEAIQNSRISIIVFSRDYAASSWCLEELVKIMECRKTVQQVVQPVFYKVDPSDVRKQSGSFAEAFAQHEKRFTAVKEKVLRWRNALTEAANLKGFHCTVDRHEGELIKEIVAENLNHVNNTYLNEAVYPVGLESRVRQVNSLLSVGWNDVRTIGICAMGGMGKTTIATAIYNSLLYCFEHKSFIDSQLLQNTPNKFQSPTNFNPLSHSDTTMTAVCTADYETHKLYDVTFFKDKIHTLLTHSPSMVNSWISNIECIHRRRLHRLIVGFDIKWRPNHERNIVENPVATINLCVDRRCLIFQLIHAVSIPKSLIDFLRNVNYTFVGVKIDDDAKKLMNEYGLGISKATDLRRLTADKLPDQNLGPNPGLKTFAKLVLGIEIEKRNEISWSNWEHRRLTEAQVQYDCADAFMSFQIGRRLIQPPQNSPTATKKYCRIITITIIIILISIIVSGDIDDAE